MKRTVSAMECDRCGTKEDCRTVEQEYAWGKVTAAEANGPKWIGSQTMDFARAKDICPNCLDQLMAWWNSLI